jgi:hypothetical protein
MDFFATQPQFSMLSLIDLLKARDQFHSHLLHKANVVGTAIGRYLIRKDDPYPTKEQGEISNMKKRRPPRTLENSEVRDYSWPAILVFVSTWVDAEQFGGKGGLSASDFVPSRIFLEDGRSVPLCVVHAPLVETRPPGIAMEDFVFPDMQIAGGYPVISQVQGVDHIASLGCLLTDGHKIYALTNRHVAGEPGEVVFTNFQGKPLKIGKTSAKQIGRMAFEDVYASWPGKNVYVNMDVGLIEIEDQNQWNPSVYGIGRLGPLADLSVYNLTLNLIGCPVRAYGCASGRLFGRIAALFYRYKSVGGFEYVSDFLIGSRDENPLLTRPGDSGTLWVVENDNVEQDLMPIAIQWGGTVFSGETARLPFALATNLSTVCRELEVDIFRAREVTTFEYWEAVGHYSIAAFACQLVADEHLRKLMLANRSRISFEPDAINTDVNDVTVPGFVPLANVPDKVWKKIFNQETAPYGRRGPENPNHYADLDFAPPGISSLDERTPTADSLNPQTWRDYYKSIHWNAVSQRGLLPFRVWQIYKKMVDFVASGDVSQFVAAAGVLSHYVGDACQPLHGSYLSDGDPFRHPDGSPSSEELDHGKGFGSGIHGAYEGDMLDAHVDTLITQLKERLGQDHQMPLVQGGRNAGFAIIELMRRARQGVDPKLLVETYGALVQAHQKPKAPEELWTKFGEKTIDVIADGCRTLAMIWESAWMEGNGAQIPRTKLTRKRKTDLRKIYEDRNFVPSVPLGQIDQYL